MSTVTLPADTSELSSRWAAAQTGGANMLWRFCQSLKLFSASNPEAKQVDIGVECAKAAGRTAPYSKSWVSRAIKCANTFAEAPVTPEDATSFMDIFHGREVKALKTKTTSTGTSKDAIASAISYAKLAVKRGMSVHETLTAIADALDAMEVSSEQGEHDVAGKLAA